METAGVVLAIIPIVVEIFKSYRTVHDRFCALKHADDIITEIALLYDLAIRTFRNEIQLLLRAVAYNNHVLAAMMEDLEHAAWQDKRLNSHLCEFLKPDDAVFHATFEWIKKELETLGNEIARLCKNPGAKKTSVLRQAAKKANLDFNISRKEHSTQTWLQNIHQWIMKLSRIRRQRCELRDASSALFSSLNPRTIPSEYHETRLTSQGLHNFLHNALSSTTGTPCNNYRAKLALGSRRHCFAVVGTMSARTDRWDEEPEPPMWVHVNSYKVRMDPHDAKTTIKLGARDILSPNTQRDPHTSAASTTMVHQVAGPALRSTSAGAPHAWHKPTLNRGVYDSICSHLEKSENYVTSEIGAYLGYSTVLVPNGACRLWLYDASKTATIQQLPVTNEEAKPLTDLLQYLESEYDQLVLAHRLTVATLQHHSSPWFGEDWNLEEIFYFDGSTGKGTSQFETRLNSLHLNTCFSTTTTTTSALSSDERSRLQADLDIRNIPLAKLGVALLQVGYKAKVYSDNPSQHHAIVTAKETLSLPSWPLPYLGWRYLEMVQKCIDCDFSVGDDLDSDALRTAVYNQIICALDVKIRALDRFRKELVKPLM